MYNFLSHTHITFLFSPLLFLSPLFLTNEKREQQGCPKSCTKIVVQISLLLCIRVLKNSKKNLTWTSQSGQDSREVFGYWFDLNHLYPTPCVKPNSFFLSSFNHSGTMKDAEAAYVFINFAPLNRRLDWCYSIDQQTIKFNFRLKSFKKITGTHIAQLKCLSRQNCN